MGGLNDIAADRDPQGLLLYALAATLQDMWLAAVDESGKSSFELAVDTGLGHEKLIAKVRGILPSRRALTQIALHVACGSLGMAKGFRSASVTPA